MKKFKTASRQSQKLAYSLISEYANYISEANIPREYWLYKAKEELKKHYWKATKEVRNNKSITEFNEKLKNNILDIFEKKLTKENTANLIIDDVNYHLRDFIEELAIELGATETFSLALRVTSQEKMNKFILYLIDYYIDNDISISDKTIEMIREQEGARYTIACIKNRKCVISGKPAEIHHVETVAGLGYNHAEAKELLVLPLSREYHNLAHSKGNKYIIKKWLLTPVPMKLAESIYSDIEIKKEIENHRNIKKIMKEGD
jgi:hypothetical protein